MPGSSESSIFGIGCCISLTARISGGGPPSKPVTCYYDAACCCIYAISCSIKSSSCRFFFRVIFGGPPPIPGPALDSDIGGPAAEEPPSLTLAPAPPTIENVGFAKAPPAFLPALKPKLGLLETDFWPVPLICGRIVGLFSPPPSIFAISPAIKSSTLSLPNLPFIVRSTVLSNTILNM